MIGRKKPEVLVVGAGPVGLFAALQLAKRGIPVEIIDKDWRTGAHSYALALHPGSLQLLDELGLLGEVLEQAVLIQSIGIYDANERQAELRAPAGSDRGGLVAVLQQDVLENLLERALKSFGVSVLWNHELADLECRSDGVLVTVEQLVKETVGYAVAHTEWTVGKTRRLEVPFVIGADGHRSRVRRRMDIEFEPAGQTQHFAVFECQTNADLGQEMKVVFADGATNVLWPMRDGRCRWSFQLLDYAAPEENRTKDRLSVQLGTGHYPVLSEESFERFLNDRAPWFDAGIGEVLWRIVVRFERRLANRFGKDRVWLAGDAGHVTGPVGMQSMNVGLAEAGKLASTLAGILGDGRPEADLEAYNRARLDEWNDLLGLRQAFQPSDDTGAWLRQHCDLLLPCLPASGEDLAALASQLALLPV